ncbi:ATP-binding protein [Sphingomonas sp. RB3P16]|uniref:sensor histidine kinase n=1 Tax=Parasphingomonas frigoris TaxID=3096163 RepID=UPI002FC6C889
MEKVFSRWPSHTQPSARTNDEGPKPQYPEWMLTPSRTAWLQQARWLGAAAASVLPPAALAFAGGMTEGALGWVPLPLALAIILSLATAIAYIVLSRAALTDYKARYEAVFERASVSTWLEDWSAVGRKISALKRAGVSDVEGYFATRPDELRELCAQVSIKDCNAFAVEEAGAVDKAALKGPLDTMLPHTDQTFVQWLVAFAQGDRFFRSEAHITRPGGAQSESLFTATLPRDLKGFADIFVTSLDITGYKIQQAKLLAADAAIARASRISSVGAFSASIAHEVNSPLAAVLANAQAALRWLKRADPDVEEATEAIAAVVTDATRAQHIIARTRAFISNTATPMGPFDVVAAAREANLLVERELRVCGAAVHLRADPGLPRVNGDLVQTQQVLTNLLINAAHAVADQEGSRDVTLTLSRDGQNVRIDIADTGHGIEATELERIFDPFYTTKRDGIGMGLAICRNCIDAQGGNIWATSDVTKGATVHFTLPIYHD